MDWRSNWQHLLDHWKSKRVPEKHLPLLYWLRQSLWLCGSPQSVVSLAKLIFQHNKTSLLAQMVKHLSAMRETWVQPLGQEDPLEKEMAIHSSTIAWKIPWTEEPGRLQSMGWQRVGHDWATSLTHKLWKILEEIKIPEHPTCLLRNLYAGQEATVRTRMEQQIGSKFGMEFNKAV